MIAYAILIAEMTSFFTFDGQILHQEHVTRLDQNMQSGEFEFKIGQEKKLETLSLCAQQTGLWVFVFVIVQRTF